MKYRWIVFVILAIGLVFAFLQLPIYRVRAVDGLVRTTDGQPIKGATVRVKTTKYDTQTSASGRFHLEGFPPALRVSITAWQDGYYVGGAKVWPWSPEVEIALSPYAVPDYAMYEWITPAVENRSREQEWMTQAGLSLAAKLSFNHVFLPLAENLTLGCRDCHGQSIFDQWVGGAHAFGAGNPRFLSMYNGTDISGNRSPPTQHGSSRDYGSFPLRPDEDKPYYGPGYKLDFPNTAGNCATCHLPSAAIEEPYGIDPNLVSGIDAQGSHCDFCHKIASVELDPTTGLPYENMPGILSINLMRPGQERQLFFGPYDDVDVGPDTYLPLMKESEICAPCHTASFWSVPIYQSFAEWLASPYPEKGETCQSCHMKPDSVTKNFAPGRGGLERDPNTIPTHFFPGAMDETILQEAVTLEASAVREEGEVVVDVTVTNDGTGHHVPTDSPLRQMILLVQASDFDGEALTQTGGPTIPNWGGIGDPAEGYFAGLPGKAYACVLQELWTEVAPTGAYWKPVRILSDNRLAAMESDDIRLAFEARDNVDIYVDVSLIFRRAYIELMDQKGWDVPDILMAEQTIALQAGE